MHTKLLHRYCVFFLLILVVLCIIYNLYFYKNGYTTDFKIPNPNAKINTTSKIEKEKNKSQRILCNFFNCFNVYQCGHKNNQLSVYVYTSNQSDSNAGPKKNHLTQEFNLILQAITSSKYYVSNPNEACILVPSFDLLNADKKNTSITDFLNNFHYQKKGKNYLLFQYIAESANSPQTSEVDNELAQAMIAGIGFTKPMYRKNFDISLPVFSTLLSDIRGDVTKLRKYFVMSSQTNINPDIQRNLLYMQQMYPNELYIFDMCLDSHSTYKFSRCANSQVYKYTTLLQSSTFCFVLKGEKLGLSILLEALAYGCIPVIIYDSIVMPFDEVIDWHRAAIFVQEIDFLETINFLRNYSLKRIHELQRHGLWLFKKYFASIKTIVDTTLEIISDRIFPYSAKNYHLWNEPQFLEIEPPILFPLTISKNDGFTAVILTYDRMDLLLLLIHKLSRIPSLNKILIVWNNEYKKPLRLSKLPKIHKQIELLQTEKNVLSNRFYPFEEIETEAVLSIDDDIIMLTEDEIEFAFEVWREFPDRLVGFPSRTHTWDNKTNFWKYESEWTNHISMVLTGAAFYHKYWNYVYTTKLPEDMKKWVDFHMNCEDIAMNFLISNITKKAPIKVTAKKKFRCPECVNTEMLSADLTHMVERTQCINEFTKVFGQMPLKLIEFRADPVLFKDNFPNKLKRFNNVGSL